MPATRRSRTSQGPAAKGSQKTISFGQSKATKSSAGLQKEKLSPSAEPSKLVKVEEPVKVKTEDEADVKIEAPFKVEKEEEEVDVKVEAPFKVETEEPAKVKTEEVEEKRTAEEERAARVTYAQIKRYWREQEAKRKAPRVHQQELTVEEKILRLFDMSSQYGPCIGISRAKRWARANKIGLEPPIEVLAVLMKEEERGNKKSEKAHVDELMNSKTLGEL